MMKRKLEIWTLFTFALLALFIVFLIYPLFGILQQSVIDENGRFTLEQFHKFFTNPYYSSTILNSFSVTIAITVSTLVLGIPFAYFYSFYQLRGAKFLFVVSILCCMSAPFIGAYAWIMLLGRSGVITQSLAKIGINIGSIYGFKGILFVQALKLYPLVFIYMNGAFKNIDNSLIEASTSLGCKGINRFFKIILSLSMPTILAASLLVFMRSFADFGTPLIIGEGFRTFPVEIYKQYIGENGTNHAFAATISVVAILVTALVFLIQKWVGKRFTFSINALHPVEKRRPKGLMGVLIYLYTYGLSGIAILPNVYIIYLSFRNCDRSVFKPGYSLINYTQAAKKLLVRSIQNTFLLGFLSLALIILISIIIAYLVVRRGNILNNTIDTLSMLPYIIPGSVIGIALAVSFSKPPIVLVGSLWIMVLSLVIRRMPYTIRSATATLVQIPYSIEEAALSLGSSKLKTFIKITVPMMANGILSGAILSWVAIVTELSSAIILYNNKTITLTMSAYVAISRGNYGIAAAFSAVLTILTTISLVIYLFISKSEDVKV